MNYEQMIRKASQTIGTLSVGDRFETNQLFKGTEWTNIPKGDRILFGKQFKNDVKSGNVPNVIFVGRKKNNHSEYEKIKN